MARYISSLSRPSALATLLASALAVAVLAVPATSEAADSVVTVDLGTSTGSLMYGATGWLYGLSSDGVPADNKLSGLRPQYTGQKAPDGLQHADGDAFEVAPQFLRNNGKAVMIYMQDDYGPWPYPENGITEYLTHVTTIANKVKANPNRSNFIYVPFNEPDWIWYDNAGSELTRFQNDWKTVYQRIRSIDPTAVIAGPNFFEYDSAAMRSFYTFAKTNNVVPQWTTWHELQTSFFSNWSTHYSDYRAIERSLGLGPLPININEYGRSSGDMGIPGQMIQYISRFETSKVYACMAYWTPAGTLNELLTPGGGSKASAWYLFKWYNDMTGTTVRVTPPTANGSLQALASLDGTKRQSTVILGGAAGSTDVVIRGFGSTSFGSTVNVTVSALANSGSASSNGPTTLTRYNATVSNGQITVNVPNMAAANAYSVTVTGGAGGPFDPNRTYRLLNRKSGKALDVFGAGTANGSAVNQWTYSGSANQRWYLIEAGGGFYRIMGADSGKPLDVEGASAADGADVIQWTYGAAANQQWSITATSGGYYRLTARHSGKVLDVSGGSTADGGAVVQTTNTGALNQQWGIS